MMYGPYAQLSPHENEFVEKYASFIGKRRIDEVIHSGKFVCEKDAEGSYITDINGKRYLDCFLATGVFSLGHKNPTIAKVIQHALTTEDFGGVFYFSEAKAELAQRLIETVPGNLDVALPTIGGGEAMDLAMKLAMSSTGRNTFICSEYAYHGSTGLAAELGPSMLNDWYPDLGCKVLKVPFADLDAIRRTITEDVAAIVIEPIRSLYDGSTPDGNFWKDLRQLCDETGTRIILDEVVCGMGRLGTLWGAELQNIEPDIMITAKGLSGGYFPMGAVVVKKAMLDTWTGVPFRAYSTYAWSNVGARVAKAAIDETLRILPDALRIGDLLEQELLALRERFAHIVRGIQRTGMHFVIETNKDVLDGKTLTLELLQRGVLLQASGAYPDAPAKILPPLTFDLTDLDDLCEKLKTVFNSY